MPRGSSKSRRSNGATDEGVGGGEIQQQKSPAEFFADNQAIAGFDNYGKSLYTSIRELMENSLVRVVITHLFCAFLVAIAMFSKALGFSFSLVRKRERDEQQRD